MTSITQAILSIMADLKEEGLGFAESTNIDAVIDIKAKADIQPVPTGDVAVVMKMPNAPSERSVNRGGGGFRSNEVYHARALRDLTLGRSYRKRGDFICYSANRSRGFDCWGEPAAEISCPDCAAKLQKFGLTIDRSQKLKGYI